MNKISLGRDYTKYSKLNMALVKLVMKCSSMFVYMYLSTNLNPNSQPIIKILWYGI